ncbi:MAG: RluA family pseudouridine synthase [Nannocystaceae bacterium]
MSATSHPVQASRVLAGQAGITLAAFVRSMYEDMPWSRAKKLCATGRVTVDGEASFDPTHRVKDGTRVEVTLTGPRRAFPRLDAACIVYIDPQILVVNKPAGLPVVSDDTHRPDCLLARLQLALEAKGASHTNLGLVHRLDPEISGLMVLARGRPARRKVEQQFRDRTVARHYQVLVRGHASPGHHDAHLLTADKSGRCGTWRGRGNPPRNAKRASTHVRVEETFGEASLVECEAETGRAHQLRVHLARAGTPVLGDSLYGRAQAPPSDMGGEILRPMIHANFIALKHPAHGRAVHFRAPLPADFQRILDGLKDR